MIQSVAVIGLGYVGLPLALSFYQKGYKIRGIDLDLAKINSIRSGKSYLPDVDGDELKTAVQSGNFTASDEFSTIAETDAVIICVPTPLDDKHVPDLSYIISAGSSIKAYLRKGQIIVLESSTYPGTTRDVLKPLLENEHMKAGIHFFIGYSPERIDPGNRQIPFTAIPKLVSGLTEPCSHKVYELYDSVFDRVVLVSSTEAAEMAKLLENSYRFINISFINEMAMLCDHMNIDAWEVIEAAGTKPYGFSAFYPGPGIGGHCIPVDPFYLQWKAMERGIRSSFIEISALMNNRMPAYIIERIKAELKDSELNGKRILVAGVTYKANISDLRESPAIEIIQLLNLEGCHVSYYDPYVPSFYWKGKEYRSIELSEEALQASDCVIIATGHTRLPIQFIVDHAPFVYDTRNFTKSLDGKAKIIRLGGGTPRQ